MTAVEHGRLILEPLSEQWRVEQDYPVRYHDLEFVVPRDFPTDLASVPRFFWRLFPPHGKYTHAAVAHDYLCATKGMDGQVDSATAHRIFLAFMVMDGTRLWRAAIMYRMVTWFGPRWQALGA